MQQLQFWRRGSSSRDMEPDEAPRPKHTAEPDQATTAAPQAGREQDGALDDVDALMAQLAERQVSHHATHVAALTPKVRCGISSQSAIICQIVGDTKSVRPACWSGQERRYSPKI